jgi:hypothetical protein
VERLDGAIEKLLDMIPTTPAGLAALSACFRDNEPLREFGLHKAAHYDRRHGNGPFRSTDLIDSH